MTARRLDVSSLSPLKGLALVSNTVKGLRPGSAVEVLHGEEFFDHLLRWSRETANPVERISENLSKVLRGKGFHGACPAETLSFYWTGVKLHAKELLLKLSGRYPRFLINFVSVRAGAEALEFLKGAGFRFRTLPAPKEVEGYCGFAAGFDDRREAERAFLKLAQENLGAEALFEKTPAGFRRLLGLWEV
ncbi:MAG: DUF3343 domain-containing protein [Aquificae bacterium]|nr:DUF3343 domain-containing protein [Aquificota bacterium]